MITLKSYTKKELSDFIESDYYQKLENIPVSYHRAVSQINNPLSDDEDILLWAAYDFDKLAGYIGVLPDVLHVEHKTKKIYWLSCFWVDNQYKEINVSSQLFFALIKKYKDQMFVSNFLLSLENTYQSLGVFQKTQYKSGQQYYIYPDFYPLLKSKWGENNLLSKVYKSIEPLIHWNMKINLDIYKSIFKKNIKKEYTFTINSEWDNEIADFQNEKMKTYSFNKRNSDYFKWVLNYPWIKNDTDNYQSDKYYFTSYVQDFENILVKIYHKGILSGWTLLLKKNKTITLKYIFANNIDFKELSTYILNLSLEKNVNSILSYDEKINHFLTNEFVFFCFRRKIKKAFLFPKNAEISHLIFQEGDGDSVFT